MFSPINYKFIYLEHKRIIAETEIDYVSMQLSIKREKLVKLIEDYDSQLIFSISGIKIKDDLVLIKLQNDRDWVKLSFLSAGERQRVIIELGIMLCVAHSKVTNIVLVIEEGTFCIDKIYFKMLIKELSKNHYKFQIIFLSVNEPYFDTNSKINTFIFTKKIPKVEIVPV